MYTMISFIISLFYSTIIVTNLLYINIGDNMRKKFKSKIRINKRPILIIFSFIIIILLLNYITKYLKFYTTKEIMIENILKYNNNYSYEKLDNNIINKIYNYLSKNFFNSPVNILKSELNYEVIQNEPTNFMYAEVKEPLVYIYNSHQGETYNQEYLEEYNIVPDVLMAAKMLKDKLEDAGIYSVVEEADILEYMNKKNYNHSNSYIASRVFLEEAIKKYPSAKLFIDLHRDAASHDVTTTNINGKECAKILFVVGLEYSTYEKNLNTSNEINNLILNKYPSLTRGIMKKEGYGVNGIYNQDLSSNIILLEVGGHENNIEEINNTIDLISEILGEYLNEKKETK